MLNEDNNIKMKYKKYTSLAITSFVMGVMTISITFITLFMDISTTVEKGEIVLHAPIITTTITLILSLVGLLLGIIALVKKTKNSSMALAGVIIHGFFLLLFI